jgi:hypothetical protein
MGRGARFVSQRASATAENPERAQLARWGKGGVIAARAGPQRRAESMSSPPVVRSCILESVADLIVDELPNATSGEYVGA